MPFKEKKQPSESNLTGDLLEKNEDRWLVLHNDDLNTFDYVIESLIEVCEHDTEQAEQCTFIVHYKGKCEVKKGFFRQLKPLKEELTRRGLTATID